jgi:hypothetical protein
MPGFTEILINIAILLAILVLPKRFGKKSGHAKRHHKGGFGLIGLQCIAILVSILRLAFFALHIRPWNNDERDICLYAGVGPVVLY